MNEVQIKLIQKASSSRWRWILMLWDSRRIARELADDLADAREKMERLEEDAYRNKRGAQKVTELLVRRGWFDNERQNLMEHLLIDRR